MSTPTSPPGDTRARIMTAAHACFLDQGYHNTTMDDIAVASGTSKGTLYWHFQSKHDLFASTIRWFFENAFGEEALAPLEGCDNAADRLRLLIEGAVVVMEQAAGLFNLFLEFWASSDDREQASHLWLDLLVEYKQIFTGVINQGIASGEFRTIDADALTWALMATYDGFAAYMMIKPDFDLMRSHAAFVKVLLKGLEAEP